MTAVRGQSMTTNGKCHKTRQQQIKYVCVSDDVDVDEAAATASETRLFQLHQVCRLTHSAFISFELNGITILLSFTTSSAHLSSYFLFFISLVSYGTRPFNPLWVVTHIYRCPTASWRYFEYMLFLFEIKCKKDVESEPTKRRVAVTVSLWLSHTVGK